MKNRNKKNNDDNILVQNIVNKIITSIVSNISINIKQDENVLNHNVISNEKIEQKLQILVENQEKY